ncbi:MAG: hypothetical protein ACKPKO_35175, partial [Candidatus Fonsibacter sp.]
LENGTRTSHVITRRRFLDHNRKTATLNHLAGEALRLLWMFFDVPQTAEAEAFGKVALVIVTTDVALKHIWQGRITRLTGGAAYKT